MTTKSSINVKARIAPILLLDARKGHTFHSVLLTCLAARASLSNFGAFVVRNGVRLVGVGFRFYKQVTPTRVLMRQDKGNTPIQRFHHL